MSVGRNSSKNAPVYEFLHRAVFSKLSAELKPLNKLADCTGRAALHQVPLFGSKLAPKEPDTRISTDLETADKANKAAEFFSENKNPARVVFALDKAGLPALSDGAQNVFTKVVPKVAPLAPFIKFAASALTAASFTYETTSCYNKPD